jgi:hypothetical protein
MKNFLLLSLLIFSTSAYADSISQPSSQQKSVKKNKKTEKKQIKRKKTVKKATVNKTEPKKTKPKLNEFTMEGNLNPLYKSMDLKSYNGQIYGNYSYLYFQTGYTHQKFLIDLVSGSNKIETSTQYHKFSGALGFHYNQKLDLGINNRFEFIPYAGVNYYRLSSALNIPEGKSIENYYNFPVGIKTGIMFIFKNFYTKPGLNVNYAFGSQGQEFFINPYIKNEYAFFKDKTSINTLSLSVGVNQIVSSNKDSNKASTFNLFTPYIGAGYSFYYF